MLEIRYNLESENDCKLDEEDEDEYQPLPVIAAVECANLGCRSDRFASDALCEECYGYYLRNMGEIEAEIAVCITYCFIWIPLNFILIHV